LSCPIEFLPDECLFLKSFSHAAIPQQNPPPSHLFHHLIFSTKDRIPFLADSEMFGKTHAYLAKACLELGAPAVIVGGVADHVHIFYSMPRTLTVADFVRDIKRTSSSWLKRQSEDSQLPLAKWIRCFLGQPFPC
jgi:REP element-mobilizing transposase RayT